MKSNEFKVTIAICTYNRAFFLEKCLESLYKYSASELPVEVLVIDNNSTDRTYELVKKFQQSYDNLNYILEKKVGLSYARNRAIQESKTKNIAYLDDDVIISDSYLNRLLWIIENYKYDCFGGMYFPWYLTERPKWISKNYGKKEKLLDSIGVLEDEFNTGLNIVFLKKSLIEIGGFPVDFGMIGNKIGYGEEDYVQHIIRKKGGIILFDPELYVYHYVQEFKHSLKWQLKSIYANSKSAYIIHHGNQTKTLHLYYLLIRTIIASIFKRLPIGLYKLIFEKNYFYQNYLLEIITPVLTTWGKIMAIKTHK